MVAKTTVSVIWAECLDMARHSEESQVSKTVKALATIKATTR